MPFKLDIGCPKCKKTFHVETASEAFIGKKIGDTIKGDAIKEFPLSDFEFMITGATDNAGFPALAFVKGSGRKKVLLKRGKGLKKVRKKKKLKNPVKGLKLRKAVHGNVIDDNISQINLKITKQGPKLISEILEKKEKPEEKKEEKKEAKPEVKLEEKPKPKEEKVEEKKPEKQKAEEKKEEKPVEKPKEEPKKEEMKEEKPKEEKKKEKGRALAVEETK